MEYSELWENVANQSEFETDNYYTALEKLHTSNSNQIIIFNGKCGVGEVPW